MADTWLPAPEAPATILADVTDTVGRLGDVLWAARSSEELLEAVRQVERLRSALDAVQLQVVAELDATDAVRAEGWASTQDFLTAVTGAARALAGQRCRWRRR
jgi:hypothetical protein